MECVNSPIADCELALSTPLTQNVNAMDTPSPPTMAPKTINSECDHASHSLTPSPQYESDDPLSHHWNQSSKRPSFMLRRLSRSNNRQSGSGLWEFGCPVSDPLPEPRHEDDDILFVPEQFERGIEMFRVTRKKVNKRICWIDPVNACVGWDSKSSSKRIISRKLK